MQNLYFLSLLKSYNYILSFKNLIIFRFVFFKIHKGLWDLRLKTGNLKSVKHPNKVNSYYF